MLSSIRQRWRSLPARLRTTATTALKAGVTVAAFYLLFTHEVRNEAGEHVSAFRAIVDYLPRIEAETFWFYVFFATGL
jgi:hypothetical protein